MGSIPPATSDNNAPRRSQRVIVKVSVMILAEGADNKPVSEETRTVTVNAHGAMPAWQTRETLMIAAIFASLLKFLIADPSRCNWARFWAYIISPVSSPYTRGE